MHHTKLMFVRQAYEKNCEVFLLIQNNTLSKMDTSFWAILYLYTI